jgi:hypothetical protein
VLAEEPPLTGKCPETTIILAGKEVRAVLDTGSNVTTITEQWYRQNGSAMPLHELTWLTLKAANCMDIPY